MGAGVSHHRAWIAGQDPWQGKCTCGATGDVVDHRWQADDWGRTHIESVERVRAMRRGQPSLTVSRDHYRKMEATATDPAQRAQWKVLADEIDHRLGNFKHDDDSPLW